MGNSTLILAALRRFLIIHVVYKYNLDYLHLLDHWAEQVSGFYGGISTPGRQICHHHLTAHLTNVTPLIDTNIITGN